MAETKEDRTKKKQLGQFMTPQLMCNSLVKNINFNLDDIILEPSFGEGGFIIAVINKLLPLYHNMSIQDKLTEIFKTQIYGVELDQKLYSDFFITIKNLFDFEIIEHNLINNDFLIHEFDVSFSWVIGNPPFGGTINKLYDKVLEKKYGIRKKQKIKKETYSFFMIKSIELLNSTGKLIFISSDTFLTIKTMKGLRMFLFENGSNKIEKIDYFSDETNYGMVVLKHKKNIISDIVIVDNQKISKKLLSITDNFSWTFNPKYSKYLNNQSLRKYITCSGGMTTGKNEYFLRKINNNKIIENYDFIYFDDPITLEKELYKARLNTISDAKKKKVIEQELNNETKRNVNITLKDPIELSLPNSNYLYYNKATSDILYSEPENVIYWKDDGDAVKTFKKNGRWYLGGIGGQNFFKKEGLSWQLISSKINIRYIKPGMILDNSAPVAILNSDIEKGELFFILGWLLSDIATEILKNVFNHTKNIQGKDVENMPYPNWVSETDKKYIIAEVKDSIVKISNKDSVDFQLFRENISKRFIFPS